MKNPRKQLVNLLIFGLAVGLFFGQGQGLSLLTAQETASSSLQTEVPPTDTVPAAAPVDEQILKRQQFLQSIKDQLRGVQSDYYGINNNVKDTEGKLIDVQETRTTLVMQLSILNQQIDNSAAIAKNVVMQIQEKEAQIAIMQNEINIKNLEIENQKKMLSEYLLVLYEQENAINDTTDSSGKDATANIAKMLLSDKSPADALRELHYFKILEVTGQNIFDKLDQLVKEQESQQLQLENSRNKLEMLYRQLEEEQSTLKTQQEAKNQLLLETKGQEDIYQQLLAESQQQESQALDDINLLRTNLKFIEDKIAELGDQFNPDDYKSVFDKETTNVYQYIKDHKDSAFNPRWPVSPSRGISAYFHDESYRMVMGIQHQAIDIRTLQGTPIHAPADGVVYKTRDNGFGYSYIILAHGGGFMTLYGHVSEIRVIEGEKILEGQVIGLSGATPGTKGAGLMTTGPHLHFEVLKGGKHVDPLDYLQLAYLPLDSLPGQALGVSRAAANPDDSGNSGN